MIIWTVLLIVIIALSVIAGPSYSAIPATP
jgi:hypothetical protein